MGSINTALSSYLGLGAGLENTFGLENDIKIRPPAAGLAAGKAADFVYADIKVRGVDIDGQKKVTTITIKIPVNLSEGHSEAHFASQMRQVMTTAIATHQAATKMLRSNAATLTHPSLEGSRAGHAAVAAFFMRGTHLQFDTAKSGLTRLSSAKLPDDKFIQLKQNEKKGPKQVEVLREAGTTARLAYSLAIHAGLLKAPAGATTSHTPLGTVEEKLLPKSVRDSDSPAAIEVRSAVGAISSQVEASLKDINQQIAQIEKAITELESQTPATLPDASLANIKLTLESLKSRESVFHKLNFDINENAAAYIQAERDLQTLKALPELTQDSKSHAELQGAAELAQKAAGTQFYATLARYEDAVVGTQEGARDRTGAEWVGKKSRSNTAVLLQSVFSRDGQPAQKTLDHSKIYGHALGAKALSEIKGGDVIAHRLANPIKLSDSPHDLLSGALLLTTGKMSPSFRRDITAQSSELKAKASAANQLQSHFSAMSSLADKTLPIPLTPNLREQIKAIVPGLIGSKTPSLDSGAVKAIYTELLKKAQELGIELGGAAASNAATSDPAASSPAIGSAATGSSLNKDTVDFLAKGHAIAKAPAGKTPSSMPTMPTKEETLAFFAEVSLRREALEKSSASLEKLLTDHPDDTTKITPKEINSLVESMGFAPESEAYGRANLLAQTTAQSCFKSTLGTCCSLIHGTMILAEKSVTGSPVKPIEDPKWQLLHSMGLPQDADAAAITAKIGIHLFPTFSSSWQATLDTLAQGLASQDPLKLLGLSGKPTTFSEQLKALDNHAELFDNVLLIGNRAASDSPDSEDLAQAIQDRDDAAHKVSALNLEYAELLRESQTKTDAITTKTAELTAKRDELATMSGQLAGNEGELTTKENDLTTKEDDLTTKEDDLTTNRADLTRKKADLTDKKADLTGKKGELATKKGELAANRKLTTTGPKPQATIDLENAVARLQGAVSQAEQAVSQAEQAVSQAEKAVNLAEKAVNLAEKAVNEAKKAVNQLDITITRLQIAIPQLINQFITPLEGAVAQLTRERDDFVQFDLKNKTDQVKTANRRLEDKNEALNQTIQEEALPHQCDTLQKLLDKALEGATSKDLIHPARASLVALSIPTHLTADQMSAAFIHHPDIEAIQASDPSITADSLEEISKLLMQSLAQGSTTPLLTAPAKTHGDFQALLQAFERASSASSPPACTQPMLALLNQFKPGIDQAQAKAAEAEAAAKAAAEAAAEAAAKAAAEAAAKAATTAPTTSGTAPAQTTVQPTAQATAPTSKPAAFATYPPRTAAVATDHPGPLAGPAAASTVAARPLVGRVPVMLGNVGITNTDVSGATLNTCYAIAALQSMRFNPTLRELVDRKLPFSEFSKAPENDPARPTAIRLTDTEYAKREQLQLAIRDILTDLDRGTSLLPTGPLPPGQLPPDRNIPISAERITRVVELMHQMRPGEFARRQQCDTGECLSFLMEKFLATTEPIPGSDGVRASSKFPTTRQSLYLRNPGAYLQQTSGITDRHLLRSTEEIEPLLPLSVATVEGNPLLADWQNSDPQYTLTKQATTTRAHGSHFEMTDDPATLAAIMPHLRPTPPATIPNNAVTLTHLGETRVVGEAHMISQIGNTPEILNFQLNRFTYTVTPSADGRDPDFRSAKIGGAIKIPLEVDIASSLAPGVIPTGSTGYKLSSVLVHGGGEDPRSGHYYMYQRLDDDSWILCNDGRVTPAPGFDPSSEAGAYMVMYKQKPADLPL